MVRAGRRPKSFRVGRCPAERTPPRPWNRGIRPAITSASKSSAGPAQLVIVADAPDFWLGRIRLDALSRSAHAGRNTKDPRFAVRTNSAGWAHLERIRTAFGSAGRVGIARHRKGLPRPPRARVDHRLDPPMGSQPVRLTDPGGRAMGSRSARRTRAGCGSAHNWAARWTRPSHAAYRLQWSPEARPPYPDFQPSRPSTCKPPWPASTARSIRDHARLRPVRVLGPLSCPGRSARAQRSLERAALQRWATTKGRERGRPRYRRLVERRIDSRWAPVPVAEQPRLSGRFTPGVPRGAGCMPGTR